MFCQMKKLSSEQKQPEANHYGLTRMVLPVFFSIQSFIIVSHRKVGTLGVTKT